MEGFLHLYYKDSNIRINKDKIMNIIDNIKSVEHTYNICMNDKIIGIYYTNEYDNYPYTNLPNFLFCPVGQFVQNKKNIQMDLYNNAKSENISSISKLAGAFSISAVDFQKNNIEIFTHVVRAESVFIYEDSEKVIVGSDPLLISVFSNNHLKPIFDASNFVSYFEQGYFADELTPYKDVKCLPPNSYIEINPQIHIKSMDDTYETAFKFNTSDELLEEISNHFINAFDVVTDKSAPIKSGLTGGKDSRIILLALLEKDFNITTNTTGFEDHPDVIVAKNLAEILKVPHSVNERKLNSKNQLPINLESRLLNITKSSSGLMSAYDSVTTNTTFSDNNNFNGVAASVITGGFNKFNHQVDKSVAHSLKKAVYKFKDFYIDENNKYNNFLEDFSKKSNDFPTLLHLFFLLYRTGRWTSDSRIPKSYSGNSISVFLDNQLTKSVMKLNMKDLRSEMIHYKLIEKLDPEILNVPFANQRFAFEKDGPISGDDYSNWLKREPIYSKSKIGSYNWRNLANNDKVLVDAFKELILSNQNNIVFDIIEYKKVESLLNSNIQSRTNKFIWSIASMIVYSNYMEGIESTNKMKIKIDVPKETIVKTKEPSKLIDLTHAYSPINKSMSFDNKTNQINLNPNENNLYLKTYSGNFNEIPDSIDIEYARSLQVHTNLSCSDYSQNINMYIIFYTKNKRFKTIVLKPIIENKNIIFNEIFIPPKHSKYFRIAIHFKDKIKAILKLNFSYVKLTY